jgi:NAD(P)-dependent dehydrogenase (short-subunit alcohol dehydrogenase family)
VSDTFTDQDVPEQTGRTILVTGANTGIGFETAAVLARAGARVLLGCRDAARASDAVERLRRRVGDADVEIVELDQASLASVAEAAAQVAEEPRLDVLVHNAGVMVPPLSFTEDGFELQFGVNHLGPFALTAHLLTKLREQPGSRVVTTSSIAHRDARLFLDDLTAQGGYEASPRYQQSKLANLLFALELDRRLRAVDATTISVACHPGIAMTELGRHMGRVVNALLPIIRPLAQLRYNSPAQGAWPTLMAATDPGVEGGEYLGPSRWKETTGPASRAHAGTRARDEELARQLWDVSVELTGLDPLPAV